MKGICTFSMLKKVKGGGEGYTSILETLIFMSPILIEAYWKMYIINTLTIP